MKKVVLALLVTILVFGGIVLVRGIRLESKQMDVEPVSDIDVDADPAAARLAAALRFRTLSHQDPVRLEGDEFLRFHRYLASTFPQVHRVLERETVNRYSLLYRWMGRNPSLAPMILMAHMDAVPVEPGTEGDWSYDAFSGTISDGHVWGRGAIDDKGGLMATLEGVETLLRDGFAPQRTVYLAFGHDEEVGGREGAVAIAKLLAARGLEPAFVIDEGGAIVDGLVPAMDRPVALVGVAEKGYFTVELTVRTAGGHSSMPPPQTAVGILSEAIQKLESRPLPGGIRGATAMMFDHLGPELPFLHRLVFANRWIFGWYVEWQFGKSPEGNALLRTTTAPTMFEAGVKENVLPSSARAVVNFRILQGDSSGSVLDHVRRAIGNPAIDVRTIGFVSEPSPVSDVESVGFRTIERTIRQVYPEVVVVPWLVVGGTDSRHFTGLTNQVFRFGGGWLTAEDLNRIHGTDERVGVEAYSNMVRFYIQLLKNAAGGDAGE
jgi:carboxypeptidase PM20D1